MLPMRELTIKARRPSLGSDRCAMNLVHSAHDALPNFGQTLRSLNFTVLRFKKNELHITAYSIG